MSEISDLCDRLEGLRVDATPGPWLSGARDGAVAVKRSDAEHGSHDGSTFSLLLPGPELWNQDEAMANAALIAAMHRALPALIAAARAASRPVSAQDGVAGVDGRGGQGQGDTGGYKGLSTWADDNWEDDPA